MYRYAYEQPNNPEYINLHFDFILPDMDTDSFMLSLSKKTKTSEAIELEQNLTLVRGVVEVHARKYVLRLKRSGAVPKELIIESVLNVIRYTLNIEIDSTPIPLYS